MWGRVNINASLTVVAGTGQYLSFTHMYVYGHIHLKKKRIKIHVTDASGEARKERLTNKETPAERLSKYAEPRHHTLIVA